MGNSLVAYTPSQIQTFDSCLADLPEYKHVKGLGSTRFMKVSCAIYKNEKVVLKIFVLPPEKILDIQYYKNKIKNQAKSVNICSNCLSYEQNVKDGGKVAVLMRQYIHSNLYDRLSTRPYLSNLERKWLAFQLICALNQMAKYGICHGDIKSENVLVTSWNWLLLTDFAPYKPVDLPFDNPAFFNYFYDTSRRRTCYIAPERFKEQVNERSELKPESDIFSVGCVIAELFSDGRRLFDLPQLLNYKAGTYSPEESLREMLPDENIRNLVSDMIQLDPAKRKSADEYLIMCKKNKIFPSVFYEVLKGYVGQFCNSPHITADQVIQTINKNKIKLLEKAKNIKEGSVIASIITPLLLSCVRKLKFMSNKLHILGLIRDFSIHLSDTVIMERVLPYVIKMIKDEKGKMDLVCSKALETLSACLNNVNSITAVDTGVFADYIFDVIKEFDGASVILRQSLNKNLTFIAKRIILLLDRSLADENDSKINKQTLHEQINKIIVNVKSKVQTAMSDNESSTRLILLLHCMSDLCQIFARQKGDDLLLSHMITVLNDKQNWQLRSAFFSTVTPVCSRLGLHSISSFLKPLLAQGLHDTEIFVISNTLKSITDLVSVGLVPKQVVLDLVEQNVAYLSHPCDWIRYNMVGFVSACASFLTSIDSHCFLKPIIKPFLNRSSVQIDNTKFFISALNKNLRSDVYSLVCSANDVSEFFNNLEFSLRNNPINVVRSSDPLEKNLRNKDLSKHEKTCLLKLKKHIEIKRQSLNQYDEETNFGIIDLIEYHTRKKKNLRRHADLPRQVEAPCQPSRKIQNETINPALNEDWNKMFGNQTYTKQKSSQSPVVTMNDLKEKTNDESTKKIKIENKPAFFHNQCMQKMRSLVQHKRDIQKKKLTNLHLQNISQRKSKYDIKSQWKPKGMLVTRMNEHKGSINRLQVSPGEDCFATVSSDRSLKVWQVSEQNHQHMVNRSRATCSQFKGALTCLSFCNDDELMCYSEDGNLHHINVNRMMTKVDERPEFDLKARNPVLRKHQIDKANDGVITDMTAISHTNLVMYVTSHGKIIALDTRAHEPAYVLHQDIYKGCPTSLCSDSGHNWLCTGTTYGVHVCWDLRFRLPISYFNHPSKARVRRLIANPQSRSSIISTVSGNNEVTVWDIAAGTPDITLWGSNAPVLSLTEKSRDSVNGLTAYVTDNDIRIITGGTDGRLRFWNLRNTEDCEIISGAERHHNIKYKYKVFYDQKLVDGTQVIHETINKERRQSVDGSGLGESGKIEPWDNNIPVYSSQVITNVALYNNTQPLLITTNSTGVVDVWK